MFQYIPTLIIIENFPFFLHRLLEWLFFTLLLCWPSQANLYVNQDVHEYKEYKYLHNIIHLSICKFTVVRKKCSDWNTREESFIPSALPHAPSMSILLQWGGVYSLFLTGYFKIRVARSCISHIKDDVNFNGYILIRTRIVYWRLFQSGKRSF